MAFRNPDRGALVARHTQIPLKRLEQLNLGRGHDVLGSAMRLEVDTFPVAAQSGQLHHLHALDLAAAEQLACPLRRLRLIAAQNDLGGGRAGEGDRAVASVNRPKLRDVLKAHDCGEPALAGRG